MSDSDQTANTPPEEPNLLERALRAAGGDAAKYIPVRFVPAITSLLTVPIFTAAISKEEYGAFYLASSVFALLAQLFTGWLSSTTIRYYWPCRREGRLRAYTSTVLWAAVGSLLVAMAAAGVLTLAAGGRVDSLTRQLIPAGLVYFFFNFLTNILVQVLRASNRAGAFARVQIIGTLLTTALSVAFVWAGNLAGAGIFLGSALGWAIVLPLILTEVKREGSLAPSDVQRDLLREMLAYGVPLIPVGLSSWALILLDRFVIGALRGTAEVGLYSVAYSLGDKIMQLATMPLLLTMAPSLTETFERRGQALAERVQTQFVRYFSIVTMPLLAGMVVAAEPFMQVFTSPEYQEAWPVIPLVAAGTLMSAMAQIAGTGLGLHKKTTTIMANTMVAAVFNVGMNLLLVPRFGYLAAALNTVLAYTVLFALSWWQSRSHMRLHIPWNAIARIAAASALMGATVYAAIGWWVNPANRFGSLAVLLGEVVMGIGVYIALIVWFGGVRPEERAFVRELGTKALARMRVSR